MIIYVLIVTGCKGHEYKSTQAAPCAYKYMNSTPVLFTLTCTGFCVTLVLFAFYQAEAFENKSPTLAPTSGELTSTVELMASFNNQAEVASATKLVLPITGGSCSKPANKKQKKEAQRSVQHVGVQGPFIKSKWSHIPPSLRRISGS
jgi:hypothetical protein